MGKADAVSSVSGSILLFLLAASLCLLTAASIAGMLILADDTAGPVPEVIAIGEIHHENPAGIVVSDTCGNRTARSFRTLCRGVRERNKAAGGDRDPERK